ncbi:MAG: hypothetical protein NTY19_43470 [Planctomycetota bacterium]|nr:hypothetical protein [Planctomycetota bacterium]
MFLNQYMKPMEIVGVQISRMRDGGKPGGAEVLVTSVVGRKERGGKRPTQSRPTPVSRKAFFQDFAAVGDSSPGAEAARSVAERLWDFPKLDAEVYRTPKAATKVIFRSSQSQRRLIAVHANRHLMRCRLVVKCQNWGWPEELAGRLEGLLGFCPTPDGFKIGDWCAKSVENVDALVRWVCEEAEKG